MLIIPRSLIKALDTGVPTGIVDACASACAHLPGQHQRWAAPLDYAHNLHGRVAPCQYRAILRTALCAVDFYGG